MVINRGPITLVSQEGSMPAAAPAAATCDTCNGGSCVITLLKCWTPDSLKMECVEHKPHCEACGCGGFLFGLLYCPKEPEKADDKKDDKSNGNGDSKDMMARVRYQDKDMNGAQNGEKKDEEKGKGEEKKDEDKKEPDLNVAMQVMKCFCPSLYDHFDHNGVKVYGWLQAGYTQNFGSPSDRLNNGVNFNSRSNEFLFNQAYFVIEKTLDLDKKKDEVHFGYRVDFMAGTDAPKVAGVSLGLWNHFQNRESARDNAYGIETPQFYVDMHVPCLTDRGIDIRTGRFYTLLGYEVLPATNTDFYSHSYEFFYAVPFTHTGVLTTTHIGDTVDFYNGFVRGWDVVFEDVNDTGEYIGGLTWNSCDKNNTVALAWASGAEQPGNNGNYRTTFTGYYTHKFGDKNQLRYVGGGNYSIDESGVAPGQNASWYGISQYLFYTCDPRLTFGVRGEWFRDNDGVRVTIGTPADYYEATIGATWRPYQNLRVRPELRYDHSDQRVYNDLTDHNQTTLGVDMIWDF